MVAITEDEVRELAGVRGAKAPVTTCYLDVDGGRRVRHADVVHRLEQLLRGARSRVDGDQAASQSVDQDLRRIEEHVRGGFDRSRTRGLAMFSCSADGFWRVIELPVPVRDQLRVNHSPSLGQLESVLDEYERFGVLLVDRQRARMFVFELGELVESEERFDQLPRSSDDDRSYSKDHARDHVAASASAHVKAAAELAWTVYRSSGFDRLVLGAPADLAGEVEAALHPYLRDRVEARCPVSVGATHDEVRAAALAVEAEVERRLEAEAVDRLREASGAGRRGVVGLEPTLARLAERRVETLLVSAGFATEGWRCGACGHVARVGRTCPMCSASMEPVEDLVEEMVDEALAQSCRVEVCVGNADLDVLGRVGALLRY